MLVLLSSYTFNAPPVSFLAPIPHTSCPNTTLYSIFVSSLSFSQKLWFWDPLVLFLGPRKILDLNFAMHARLRNAYIAGVRTWNELVAWI